MKLFYRKFGEGDPIIILHGLLGLSDQWIPVAKKLSFHNYAVYIPDQRDHGQSGHTNKFNFDVLCSDLLEFIEAHEIINPIIIGHSMGGKIAMHVALNNLTPIKKLIIVDIGIKQYLPSDFSILEKLTGFDLSSFTKRADIEQSISLFIRKIPLRKWILKNIRLNAHKTFEWKFNLPLIRQNAQLIFEEIQSLKKYTHPIYFIQGEYSNHLTKQDFPEIKNIFPMASFLTVKNASHWVHVDNEEDFLHSLLKII